MSGSKVWGTSSKIVFYGRVRQRKGSSRGKKVVRYEIEIPQPIVRAYRDLIQKIQRGGKKVKVIVELL